MTEKHFRIWTGKYMFTLALRSDLQVVFPLWVHDNPEIDFKKCVMMQYFVLKDINGIRICEGDIVLKHWEYPEDKPVIIDYIFNILQYELTNKCEIIGNIYENPELLPK